MTTIKDVQYNDLIANLSYRAKLARKTKAIIGLLMMIMVMFIFTFLLFRVTGTINKTSPLDAYLLSSKAFSNSDVGGVVNAINRKLDGVKNEGGSSEEEIISKINALTDIYVRIMGVSEKKLLNNHGNTDNLINSISTIALSIGAVSFVLYIMQIAISFIRYYSRLAELYDSQRTALIAANGDILMAKEFIEAFSSESVSLGKEPVTLYSKSLDVISEVVKSNNSKSK
ncbi:hypothetical protein DCF38_13185 [Edwardsiella piscicida]|uniref:hypothetical protein n=1 Tax=Edwardsiella piscicida TaxID=1263550 RepID=UPI001056E4FC|nr:hypothetical protein [Edwardsiella piscicida]UCQ40466.1 hypothetical protein DCF38_13185 [Edwardsiella piscicida]